MNLKRCENGHFYDADKFASCPHCAQPGGGAAAENLTVGADRAMGGAVTMPTDNGNMGPVTIPEPEILRTPPVTPGTGASIRSSIGQLITEREPVADDDNKTVYFSEDKGVDPVVGWLVCIQGAYFGESFKLKTGRNFIGRAHNMDIVLGKDNSVARDKHAIVLYEPRKREFLAQPGESRGLFYLNDDVVLMTEKLNKGDVLTLGNTKLMFIPCCGPDFGWDDMQKEG